MTCLPFFQLNLTANDVPYRSNVSVCRSHLCLCRGERVPVRSTLRVGPFLHSNNSNGTRRTLHMAKHSFRVSCLFIHVTNDVVVSTRLFWAHAIGQLNSILPVGSTFQNQSFYLTLPIISELVYRIDRSSCLYFHLPPTGTDVVRGWICNKAFLSSFRR